MITAVLSPLSGFYKFVRQNVASRRTESRLGTHQLFPPDRFDASADRAPDRKHRAKNDLRQTFVVCMYDDMKSFMVQLLACEKHLDHDINGVARSHSSLNTRRPNEGMYISVLVQWESGSSVEDMYL